jgi:hypothetical protein
MRSDLLIGNLETPLTYDLPMKSPIGAQFRFGASKQMAAHLVDGGFTALSLANNHAFDLRAQGMIDSPVILRELGLVPLGAARTEPPLFRVETLERSGWKVGILAITARRNAPHFAGSPRAPLPLHHRLRRPALPVIAAARSQHDLIIVFVHWGEEYADDPAPHQRRAAKALLDHGADLVVGHHPPRPPGHRTPRPRRRRLLPRQLPVREHPRHPPPHRGPARPLHPRPLPRDPHLPPRLHQAHPSKHPAPATGSMGKLVRARMTELSATLATSFELKGDDLTLGSFPCSPAAAM